MDEANLSRKTTKNPQVKKRSATTVKKLVTLKQIVSSLYTRRKRMLCLQNWDEESFGKEERSEEVANVVCFMANDHDEVSSNSSCDHDDIPLSDIQKLFLHCMKILQNFKKSRKNLFWN